MRSSTTILLAAVCLAAAEGSRAAPAPVRQDWVVHYAGSADGIDNARAVAADMDGNVYVTGGALETTYDYVTVKYDAAGREVWVARYDGGDAEDYAMATAVDSDGFIYVTGSSRKLSPDRTMDLDSDYATIKYDADGNQVWVARYDGGSFDEAMALVVDTVTTALKLYESRDLYVTGLRYCGNYCSDAIIVKYDSNGNQLWLVQRSPPVLACGSEDATGVIGVDRLGNVYVNGPTATRCDGGFETFDQDTIKYDPNGNVVWAIRYRPRGAGTVSSGALDCAGTFISRALLIGTMGRLSTCKTRL